MSTHLVTHLNESTRLLWLVLHQETQNCLGSGTRMGMGTVNMGMGPLQWKKLPHLAKHGSVWELQHASKEAQPSSVRHPHHHVRDAT